MATFKSDTVTLGSSAETVFEKLSNLDSLRALLDKMPVDQIPEDKRQQLEAVKVTSDTITIPGGPAGEVTLKMTEKVPYTLIRLDGQGTPVPLNLSLHLTPLSAGCEALVEIDIQIPMMLAPMVKGPLQKMVDQFARALQSIPME